jgi:hypothetical protein
MSDMKLIMEGWRQYIAIHESASGTIVLFEGRHPRRVDFRGLLNEVDDNKIGTFIAEWERSVDYQLSEGAVQDFMENPVLSLSVQAFMLLDRVKEKAAQYASKIAGVVNKIRSFAQKFEKKQPTVYRIGMVVSKVLLSLLAVLALSAIFGVDAAQAGDLVNFGAGDAASDLIASGADLEKLGTALQNSTDPMFQEVSAKMLEIASAPENITKAELGPLQKEFMEIANVGLEKLQGVEGAKELAAKATELVQTATEYARSGEAGPTEVIGMLKNSAQAGHQEAITQLQQMVSQGTSPEVKELAKAALDSLP